MHIVEEPISIPRHYSEVCRLLRKPAQHCIFTTTFFLQMNIFHLRCAHIKCTWNKWLMRVHGFRTFSASFTHYFETNGILELYALNHWTMHMLISNNIVCCPTEFKIFQNPIASKCHFHLIFIIHWPFNMHICMCMLNCA